MDMSKLAAFSNSRIKKTSTLFLLSVIAIYCNIAISAVLNTDSGTSPTTIRPAKILTINSGYISSYVSGTDIPLNSVCPPNYTEYVTVTANKFNSSTSKLLAGAKACVTGSYKTSTNTYAKLITSLSYHEYERTSGGKYVSTGAWDVWHTEDMPDNDTVKAITTDSTAVGAIYWTLYCYPPSITPPTYSCP